MAKIESIKFFPNDCNKRAELPARELSLEAKISFHQLDLQLHMEYKLHVLFFAASGQSEMPLLFHNWDQSGFVISTHESNSEVVGQCWFTLKASKEPVTIKKSLSEDDLETSFIQGIKAFGSLVPAVGKAVKWSNEYFFDLSLK